MDNAIKAAIFDLDGVLVDTAHYHYLAWRRVAERLDIPFTEADNERLKGVSRSQSLEYVLQKGKESMHADEKREWAARKNAWYLEYLSALNESHLLPGARAYVAWLKKAGVRIGLGTSSKNAGVILERLRIQDWFDAAVDGSMVAQTKPDPEVFLKCAHLLHVRPECCLVLEDSTAGIQAAKNAGMKCIGIGDKHVLTEADRVVSGLQELLPSKEASP
ncbi:beta-phosphoglucomutase [Cohnella hashimotonis]|uniref:Beta-phosphoglucomutase n=1 Tax=Cohnella hashimotonis TaxID=2826895 RepID=A0ABT6TNN9_9BACL|nr:beta-phosphoglucomutase [Cohnella hashimotonis]MDI4648463.1 beta-phosphoglucomutase [Cohnella hashimotonis]